MESKGLFRRILDIREGEGHSAGHLFILQFLQGASIAILFTAAITLFLEELPVRELPLVYLVSSVFLWGTGWLYARLEHKLQEVQLSYLIIAFNVMGALVIRYLLGVAHTDFSFYAILVFYNIAYLLYNLNFWGMAAQMYDVRESKRLFALVSAGDIPAKFLGYLAAFFFVKELGAHDLLYISAGFYLVSIIWANRLTTTEHEADHGLHKPDAEGMISTLFHHRLIRQMATLSFLSTSAYLIVSFILYGYIKHEFHDEVSLGTFIAALLAGSHVMKMVVKMFLAGRLQRTMSLKGVLLITPTVLMGVCLIAFVLTIASKEILALSVFGVMAVLTDMLRSSIQYPVMMSSMQVLPLSERMVGHTVMKGVMDPLAFFLVGGILYFAGIGAEIIDFRLLCGLLFLFLLASIWVAMPVEKEYINRLVAAIRTRDFGGQSIRIEDPEMLEESVRILQTGTEEEALFLLRVSDPETSRLEDLLKAALRHPSGKVRQAAAIIYADAPHLDWKEDLKEWLEEENSPMVIQTLLKEKMKTDSQTDLSMYLTHEHREVREAVLAVLLNYPENEGFEVASQQVIQLLESDQKSAQLQGLQIVSLAEVKAWTRVDHFLGSSDTEVVWSALYASGILADSYSIPQLFSLISSREYKQLALQSLGQMNADKLIPAIAQQMDNKKDVLMRQACIQLLAMHNSEESCHVLLQVLHTWPEDKEVILHALVKHNYAYVCKGKMHALIDQLQEHAERLYSLQFVFNKQAHFALLEEAIQKDIILCREYLLKLILLQYDDQRVLKSLHGISSGKKELVSTSFELLEKICGVHAALRFSTLFEPMGQSDRKHQLQQAGRFHLWDTEAALMEIADRRNPAYSPWVLSLSIYLIKDFPEWTNKELLEKKTTHPNKMIRETAAYVLAE